MTLAVSLVKVKIFKQGRQAFKESLQTIAEFLRAG